MFSPQDPACLVQQNTSDNYSPQAISGAQNNYHARSTNPSHFVRATDFPYRNKHQRTINTMETTKNAAMAVNSRAGHKQTHPLEFLATTAIRSFKGDISHR